MSHLFTSVQEVVDTLRPRDPVFIVRPRIVAERARRVLAAFPGDVLYAVKCNDDLHMVDALYDGGLRHFDTASIAEVRMIAGRFHDVTCHFMHPVKSREAIAEAYFTYGVRTFAFDHIDELNKIFEVTHNARDLTLVCRIETPSGKAMMCLSGKFGTSIEEAARLLRLVDQAGCRTGLTFHVGSQCVDPAAFAHAVELAGEVLSLSGVDLDLLDVGGGFPGEYTGDEPAFEEFVAAVVDACDRIGLPDTCRLACEPGRALSFDGVSVVTRVELRRDESLYLNDGTYGSLAELRWLGNCFPLRLVRPDTVGRVSTEAPIGFTLYGPTCDSIDTMPGPHWVSGDVREGDWIEVGLLGAYSNALRTRFNGFSAYSWETVDDEDVPRSAVIVPLHKLQRAA